MLNKNYIKSVGTGLFLFVFTIAITPKLYLHYLFAHHTDQKGSKKTATEKSFSTSGYNCKCDDQVAESNFLALPELKSLTKNPTNSRFVLSKVPLIFSYSSEFSDRGPPSMI